MHYFLAWAGKEVYFYEMNSALKTGGFAIQRGGRIKRFFRYWHLRLVRIQASPHSIAVGVAAGVFAGLLPILPLQTLLAVLLAFVFRGSKVAAVLGTWISNPLNVVPQYMLAYYLGRAVMPFEVAGFDFSRLEMARMLDLGWPFLAAMLTGGLLMALPGACLAYAVTAKGIHAYRRQRRTGLSSS